MNECLPRPHYFYPQDAELCPCCNQWGKMTAPGGFILFEHSGRRFPCRPRREVLGTVKSTQTEINASVMLGVS